jgi:hypothetical protein
MSSKNIVADLEDTSPQSNEDQSFSVRSKRVEEGCQAAVKRAIKEHLAMGRPIYFRDPKGRLVKQMPDGRRFAVRVSQDGEEVVLQQLEHE